MRISRISTAVTIVLLIAVPLGSAGASGLDHDPDATGLLATTPVAVWEMNEPAGTRTMSDSSGNGFNGTSVISGNPTDTGMGYRWKFKKPNSLPVEPERLVVVPDQPGLDPGDQTFTLTFRFRTINSFGNYLQKGQAKTAGGQIKVQGPNGKVSCLFKGSLGQSATGSRAALNDGQWHTVVCRRDEQGVTMYVDGEFRSRSRKPTGTINNAFPWTIGGKPSCDQIQITCDYYTGEFDYFRIDVG